MSIDKKSTHYDAGGIETITIIKAKLTEEQYTGYLLGNCLKYTCRLNHKNDSLRDSEKVKNYSSLLVDNLQSENTSGKFQSKSKISINVKTDDSKNEIESLFYGCKALLNMDEQLSHAELLHQVYRKLDSFFIPNS